MAFERRYSIREVSQETGLPDYVLRQWEKRFPQLRPKRDRNERRYYTSKDIEIVKRIQYLMHHEKLKTDGARLRLSQELYGIGKPRTNREVVELADKMAAEVREMLDLLDRAEGR